MAGFTSIDPCYGTKLAGTSALQCQNGIIGGSAGQAWDTELFGVYIEFGAGPPSLTIAGLQDNTGAAQNLLITGSTTTDYFWMPPAPIVNSKAAFVFTPSVTLKITVFVRAYNGPEKPETRVTT